MELTLRYTTPDIRCRHRRHECDGEIRTNSSMFVVCNLSEPHYFIIVISLQMYNTSRDE